MLISVLIILMAGLVLVVCVLTLRLNGVSKEKDQQAHSSYQKPESERVSYLEPKISAIQSVLKAPTPDQSVDRTEADRVLGIDMTQVTTNSNASNDDINEKLIQEEVAIDNPALLEDERKTIVLYLLAAGNRPYSGYELLQSILSNGFRYGEQQIFHRYQDKTNKGPILFSLASAQGTGTFDLPKMGGFMTQGLVLVLDVHTVEEPMAAFELMLHVAGQLSEDLGGKVLDENRELLTKEMVRELCLEVNRFEKSKNNLDLFSPVSVSTIE
jgi:cell division protein ZipA